MKKSKFLKKSLAMLLALMLVVAMIPLSASAEGALPNLTLLYVGNSTTRVPVKVEGDVFKADISKSATDVYLAYDDGSLGTTEGDATLEVYKDSSSTGLTVADNSSATKVEFSNWASSDTDSTVTLKLRVISNDKTATKEYTVELTRKAVGVTADLEKAVPGDGVYKAEVNNAARTVDIEVARGALTSGAKFSVVTKDNATVSQNSSGATVSNNVVTVTADKQSFTVTSQSTNNKVDYTVNVTEIDGLLSFAVDGNEGKITDEDGNGTPETVTVTLPKSVAYDSLGYELTNVVLPISFTVYGNSATVKIDSTDYKSGDKVDFKQLIKSGVVDSSNDYVSGTGKSLVVTCEGVDQPYTLKLKFEESTDSAITYAQLDGEIATIEGDKISAVLPVKEADGTATELDKVQVLLYTDPSVKTVSGFVKFENKTGSAVLVDGKQVWALDKDDVTAKTMDLSNSKIVTVTAENGTTSQYTISATIDDNKDEAYLTALSLKNGNTEYKGTIKDHTITFTVPYMTIDASGWKVYATPNASANVVGGDSSSYKAIVNGTSTLNDLADATDYASVDFSDLSTTANTNKGTIVAVNKNDNSVFTEYTVVINLEDPALGKTLNTLKFSAQTKNPSGDYYDRVTARVSTTNTVVGEVTSKSLAADNTGTITLRPPYSLSVNATATVYNIVTEFTTKNGGVAFLASWNNADSKYDNIAKLIALPNTKDSFSGNSVEAGNFGATAKENGKYYVIVLPEDVARTITTEITTANLSSGTLYTVSEEPQPASAVQTLKSMTVKDTALTVSSSTSEENEEISGTLPWSATAKDYTTPTETAKALYATYETVSPYAILTTDGTSANRFYSNGDKDGDGESDTTVEADNQKFLFVRSDDEKHTVKVYVSADGSSYSALTNNQVTVLAEDGQSKKTYTFNLTWADPNTEATISSFKIGNSTGTISSDRKISVTVPYGTDLKGLIPTFTASSGATVAVAGGADLVSGKTTLNFTNPVNLVVTSEDGKKTMNYTVTVTVADQFTDVQPGDWFYENVMRAVELGIAKGKGNGIFDPYGKITRRDFAIMLAQAMGQSNDGEAVSPFVDVADDDYGVVSIAFLYEKGITVGDANGNFNPNSNITRQEVAIMMAKAFGATGTTDEVFTDDAKIASWAKSYVYAAKAAGLMNGDVDGSFRPNDSFTRAEAASAMVNAIDK